MSNIKNKVLKDLVINPPSKKCSHITIYDPDCPNDDDYEDDSYGSGSVLEFHYDELEEIKNPSAELIEKCKDAKDKSLLNLFNVFI